MGASPLPCPLYLSGPTDRLRLLQLLFPGLVILLRHPPEVMAVPSLVLTFLVTTIGIRSTPSAWVECAACEQDNGRLRTAVQVFTKICIVFIVYTVRSLPATQLLLSS